MQKLKPSSQKIIACVRRMDLQIFPSSLTDEGILLKPIIPSLLLIFLTLYLLRRGRSSSRLKLPPSLPHKLPLIGNLHQLGTQLHRVLKRLSDKHGPVMLIHLGKSPWVIVSSPEYANEVVRKDMALGRPQLKPPTSLTYGCNDVIFSAYGEFWRQARRICVSELLSQKKVKEFQSAREEEVSQMIDQIRARCRDGSSVNIRELSETVSSNVLSRCAFGRVYEREADGKKSFAEMAKQALALLSRFTFEDMIPWFAWLDKLTGFDADLKRTSKELDEFLDEVIEEHQALRRYNQESEKKDLVDILLDLQKDQNSSIKLTQENLKAILLDMFLGGTDTTAITMEWAMAELMKNSRILKQAQEEVRKIVGTRQKITENDTDQMSFMKCVIKETLRMHPTLGVGESPSGSVSNLGGYDIPPNTRIIINTWALHRDPTVWDRPDEFAPERFEDSLIDFTGQRGRYRPFGAGKRSCPGMSFALVELEYVLANLLYWFDWKLPDGVTTESLDMTDTYKGIICKKTPLHVVAVPRRV